MPTLKALVVDDKSDQLKLAQRLLSSMQIEVSTASNGEEAVKIVSEADKETFHFLLIDIHMPDMSGIEVAKTVRNAGYNGAIFAFTAHPTMEGKKKGEGSGIDAFLSKLTLKRELIQALIDAYVKQ